MIHPGPAWLQPLDSAILRMLVPLTIAILIGGLDDAAIDAAWLVFWLRKRNRIPPGPESVPKPRIAILIPLWREHQVIARMLEHNLASIRYDRYEIFAGAYPNDDRTQDAVRHVSDRFTRVHLTLCPHDGPTSKADCLNWIWQHVLLYEEQRGLVFDLILVHDAEDLIHPDELAWIARYAAHSDFIQTPVLALPTPLHRLTHGVYCDEFAEFHTRDMMVRPHLGGFLPSAGVGTAYRREALDRLAVASGNRVFEPEALTEDYENGLRLFRLGCSQAFVPIIRSDRGFIATREYFPQSWGAALRQRTRWTLGIVLQSWERYGWGRTMSETYWLWRDRKGLAASPLSLLANLIAAYGAAAAIWTRASPLAARLAVAAAALAILRLGVRMACVARIYGSVFALGVPLRAIYANALNTAAAFNAIGKYALARARHRPLRWVKTDHAFPSRAALLEHRRRLGEILTGSGYLESGALAGALASRPEGVRLGEHLVHLGLIDQDSLYEALSLQQGLPLAGLSAAAIAPRVARAIPEEVVRQWRVLPFQIAEGSLFLASPELPSPAMTAALRSFTALEIRFHLVTPARFDALRSRCHE